MKLFRTSVQFAVFLCMKKSAILTDPQAKSNQKNQCHAEPVEAQPKQNPIRKTNVTLSLSKGPRAEEHFNTQTD
ncbi:hypothetical protein [Flavobacterium silvisoli]|uniref:hypothetical protein n=1 Tax=Flavobacterium silvisoli TaxID=2529433 RepID=UPI00103C7362|nr:hypothetical protein [Flavobacterium silvisoli]